MNMIKGTAKAIGLALAGASIGGCGAVNRAADDLNTLGEALAGPVKNVAKGVDDVPGVKVQGNRVNVGLDTLFTDRQK